MRTEFLCVSVLRVASGPRVKLASCLDLSVSSSSWGLGRAAVCDCGTPWTFLLPFFSFCLPLLLVPSTRHCRLAFAMP